MRPNLYLTGDLESERPNIPGLPTSPLRKSNLAISFLLYFLVAQLLANILRSDYRAFSLAHRSIELKEI